MNVTTHGPEMLTLAGTASAAWSPCFPQGAVSGERAEKLGGQTGSEKESDLVRFVLGAVV